MGNRCQRRREAEAEEEDWIVIQDPIRQAAPSAAWKRFRRSVRRVQVLLKLRIIWSSLGRQLQRPTNTHFLTYNHTLRRTEAQSIRTKTRPLWSNIGRYLQNFAPLFHHLERRQGKLEYKTRRH